MFKPRVQLSLFITLVAWQNTACAHKQNVDVFFVFIIHNIFY